MDISHATKHAVSSALRGLYLDQPQVTRDLLSEITPADLRAVEQMFGTLQLLCSQERIARARARTRTRSEDAEDAEAGSSARGEVPA